MEKNCRKHGLTEFSLRKDGYYKCKRCTTEAVQKRRDKLKKMAIAYKGGKCQTCGYNKYVGALEFHHINNDKDFGISAKGYTRSWENVKLELNKCVLLCSNCHREAHANMVDVLNINTNCKPIIIDKQIKINKCADCGVKIDRSAKRCQLCNNIHSRKVKFRPNKEILLAEIKNSSYLAVGKKYGVSDNAIRKWIK